MLLLELNDLLDVLDGIKKKLNRLEIIVLKEVASAKSLCRWAVQSVALLLQLLIMKTR